MFGLGVGEIAIILFVALIFIGPKKLPGLARGLGKGIREFQNAAKGITDVVNNPTAHTESQQVAQPMDQPMDQPADHEGDKGIPTEDDQTHPQSTQHADTNTEAEREAKLTNTKTAPVAETPKKTES